MQDKRTRGRPSKIDLLPSVIRDQLHGLLRDKRHTQEDIRAAVNELIDGHGLGDDMKLSRTGLNRYASRMEEIGSKIRQSREVAEVWCAKLGDAPTSDVGKLLQEVVRTLAFETGMAMSENGEPVEPKAISQLALAIQRVEQAAMTSLKREKEIRAAFAAEAADKAEKSFKQAGLTADAAADIRRQILGIV
ncbi:DUF3486 family protein [Erwinia tracheiphila]|uniref:DUF3486 family protein n=1 Tax=Erwinia tracheiphila TaxID=65700 RepID=UPI001F1E455B|nr:DUF3486 family protein [Erwinia tracheiphila]UIA93072.1 DUF3486 family protein [Erwinia tracheiphila]